MSSPTAGRLDRFRPRGETLLWGALAVAIEVFLLGAYALVTDARLTGLAGIRYWLYPFVWINVGAWVLFRTRPAPTGPRRRRTAAAIAVGYFAVLAYVAGMVGPAPDGVPGTFQVALASVPPGWAPTVVYSGSVLAVTLIPFEVVGYTALAYLVYATVIDAAGSAVTGVVGLLSCVSCTWPVLASLITGVVGSGTAVAGAVYTQSYDLSTAVFLVTVALLFWRPFGFDR